MEKVTCVGLDVHAEWIVAVWKKAKGTEQVAMVANTTEGWEQLVKAVGTGEVVAAYEASGVGFQLHDWLNTRGWKTYVVAPTHLARSSKGKKTKTDVRDARRLMELLMAHETLGHELAKVWVPPVKVREDREIVRRRLKLSETVTQAKNGIVGLLRMHRIERPEEIKTAWTKKHVAWLRKLSEEPSGVARAIRVALGSLVRELEFVEGEMEKLDGEVENLAKEKEYEKPAGAMTEISGVGTLTAMTFLLELGDPKRFQNRRQVGSYLGLVPTSYESMNERKGHITRMGPPRLRKVLNQAAWVYLRENEGPKGWYRRTAERRGKKKAIVGLMRLLGIEMWRRARSALRNVSSLGPSRR